MIVSSSAVRIRYSCPFGRFTIYFIYIQKVQSIRAGRCPVMDTDVIVSTEADAQAGDVVGREFICIRHTFSL